VNSSFKNVIGTFVNVLPLKIEINKNRSFKDFLLIVKRHIIEAFENQDFQYDQMVSSLNLSLERKIVDIYFSYVNFFESEQELNSLEFVPIRIEKPTITTRYELELNITESIEQLILTFTYSSELYDADTIELFIQYYTNMLSHILEDINTEIDSIRL
jgi:non-ribosomal peptide synthetase component F